MATNKELARRFVDEVWGKRDYKAYDDIAAPDCEFYDPFEADALDKQSYKRLIQEFDKSFSVKRVTTEEHIDAGDVQVVRFSFTTRMVGSYAGQAASQQEATVDGIVILRFKNGKLAESRSSWNTLSFMRQIGLIALPMMPSVKAQPHAPTPPTH